MTQTGYVIVITAFDGTVSVCGPYADPAQARKDAEQIKASDCAYTAPVYGLERPAAVLAELRAS